MYIWKIKHYATEPPVLPQLQHTPSEARPEDSDDIADAWRVVGSPPRRPSSSNSPRLHSTGTDLTSIPASVPPGGLGSSTKSNDRRRSVSSDRNSSWDSFGGLQWYNLSIFDASESVDTISTTMVNTTTTPNATPSVLTEPNLSPTSFSPTHIQHSEPYHPLWAKSGSIDSSTSVEMVPPDILSVPMLPGVSFEPIYRQHRSRSFSIGQDPAIFGYGEPHYPLEHNLPSPPLPLPSMLATMNEEVEERVVNFEEHHCRARSQSYDPASWLRAPRHPGSPDPFPGPASGRCSAVRENVQCHDVWPPAPSFQQHQQQQKRRLSMFEMGKR